MSTTVSPELMARVDRERRSLKKMIDMVTSDMDKAEQSGDFNDDLCAAMIFAIGCNPSAYLHAVKDAAESIKKES